MRLFSTANKLLSIKVARWIANFSILYSILYHDKANGNLTLVFIALLTLLEANYYLRNKYLKVNKGIWYYLSYGLSVIIIGYFTYKIEGFGSQVYDIILLIEIIVTIKKIAVLAVIFNFIVYWGAYISGTDFGSRNILINYVCILFVVFLFRNIMIEKSIAEKLNQELKSANLTLEEYSTRIEELTIANERTRIAQELHDSMGHSLIALKMNLEFAENIIEQQPAKAKEVVNKAQDITKDCITNLRKAVSLLKEDSAVEGLRVAINELFQNFKGTNGIRMNLEMDDAVETLNPDIKNCIYKTVRESFTNGIKHGDSKQFTIQIVKKPGMIYLKVSNDGLGCKNIVKSNGIKGIEDRINALGGKGEFSSEKGFGFAIEASIPEMED